MARKRTKDSRSYDAIKRKLLPIIRSVAPHHVLTIMAKEYTPYIRKSQSDAEQEYWIKVARSSANLASGMEKWLEEFIGEEEDE